MPANEPLMGLPYPLSSDSDDVPRDIKALADAAALKMNLIPRTFATTAARDALFAANPGLKVPGMVAVIGSGATYAEYVWTGAVWRPWITPWQTVYPESGFAANAAAVRLLGGVTAFKGDITGTVAENTSTRIGWVPSGWWPVLISAAARAAGDDQTGVPLTCWVDAGAGGIWVRKQTATGTCTLSLGALGGYSID